MRVLIDINHPAHVHYFRNFSGIMQSRGHEILFVSRNKEMAHRLLNLYNITYIDRGKGKNGAIGKFLYMAYADWKLVMISRKFKPDVFLNFLHPYPSQVAKYLGKVSLVFSDSEHARLHHQLTVPFATKVFTPACYSIALGDKQQRFNSYMELAYLHPNYFTPDSRIHDFLGVKEGERYVIVRFVSWEALHDVGQGGVTLENKRKAVRELSKYARVFISAEGSLPQDLEQYRIKIPVDKIHDALYYSALLFGESGTMASEAAVLGTPSIFINSLRLGYLEEQETKYGLVNNYRANEEDQHRAIDRALEILQDKEGKARYSKLREGLLSECIDTTEFMLNEVLRYDSKAVATNSMPLSAGHLKQSLV